MAGIFSHLMEFCCPVSTEIELKLGTLLPLGALRSAGLEMYICYLKLEQIYPWHTITIDTPGSHVCRAESPSHMLTGRHKSESGNENLAFQTQSLQVKRNCDP